MLYAYYNESPFHFSYVVVFSDLHTGEIAKSRTSAETLYVRAFMLNTSVRLPPNRLHASHREDKGELTHNY